jgi:hypothetical protein
MVITMAITMALACMSQKMLLNVYAIKRMLVLIKDQDAGQVEEIHGVEVGRQHWEGARQEEVEGATVDNGRCDSTLRGRSPPDSETSNLESSFAI